MKTFETPKGTKLPLLNLKGKDYLQVQHRIVWFREEHPDWGIETDVRMCTDGTSSIGVAHIKDKEGRTIATAHKMETSSGFADFVEKSETGAIGRALALCGYGTQFTVDLEEGDRLADSPVDRGILSSSKPAVSGSKPQNHNGDYYISDLQVKRFHAIAYNTMRIKADHAIWLKKKFGLDSPSLILKRNYDQIINRLKELEEESFKAEEENRPPPITDEDQIPF